MTCALTSRSNQQRRRSLTPTEAITDEELVELARQAGDGDLRPFDRLVERHRGRVLANCRHLTRAANDLEDLAQEVFVKVFFALARFEGRSSFSTWMQRIKINHCLNYNERRKGRQTVDVEDPALSSREELRVEPQAEHQLLAMSQRERIAFVLDALSETLRVPLVLRDADGASYQEIADHLGVGLSAVKMRIKRARGEFRSRWLEAFGDADAAQGENEATQSEPAWTGSLGLSWLATSGNTDTSSGGLDFTLNRKPVPWGLEIVARGTRAEQDGEVTAENYLASGRAVRKLSERWDAFGGLSYARDEFAGFESQYIVSSGATYHALLGPKHVLSFDAGLAWTTEDLVTSTSRIDYLGGLLGLSYEWKLSGGAKLTERLLCYPNFDESDDWRVTSVTALESSVNSWLALRLGYEIRYRNLPVGDNTSTDTAATASVVFDF